MLRQAMVGALNVGCEVSGEGTLSEDRRTKEETIVDDCWSEDGAIVGALGGIVNG